MTLKVTRRFICSPGADSGHARLDLLAGPTMNHSGLQAALVSRSAQQGKAREPMIQGTCGRTYIASPVPPGPLSSWENRLRQRLAMVGSTESALIWREKVTPAGQLISRLAVSTRHTNGTGNTGSAWRTPNARKEGGGSYSDPEKALKRETSGHQINLEEQMVVAAHWATPTARDYRSERATVEFHQKRDAHPRGKPLADQLTKVSASPTSGDGLRAVMIGAATGQTPNGSPATTTKRGAPNPVFAFWLMGFPEEWISGALEAMQSYRKPREKSSQRSSTSMVCLPRGAEIK